ncbi:MAG TPA: VWA domain-containing protein [Saprospiraceae bacterium]|nr:VWA domain-containing protein [Saprospiraceae bacterium]HMQ81994.1 VWA domain-containing protein [Saprospiraceae bacterium]
MMMSDNIQFVNPEFFLLLLLLPLIAYWYWKKYTRYHAALRMPSLESVSSLPSWKGRLRGLLPILRTLAFTALVVAMARPQAIQKEEEVNAEGIDIMLAIDLSSSMLAQDFKPDRLEVSKRVAGEFVVKRAYDRIGLAVFAGEAFTQCPLTSDHRVLTEFLQQLQCGILEDGTAIGMGLATAVSHLEKSEAKSKVVILLTDGVNNSGYINPLMSAGIAQKLGIKVYTIGVGSTGDALTPVSRRTDGRYIFGLARVEIDEALLQEIAAMTGGEYFRATSAESLEKIYNKIDQLEKTLIEVTVLKRYSEVFHPFAFWGILFLLVELVLRYTVFRTIP